MHFQKLNFQICSFKTKLTKFLSQRRHFKNCFVTLHLETNKYLSKIRKSSSCIFSKYYMLSDKKQKNENFLSGRFFLMWA